jgi:quinol monooxygenase YgiN
MAKGEGHQMIQAFFRFLAPKDKRHELLDVLLCLKGPTESLPECRACWVCQDVEDSQLITYLVQWDTLDDLQAHLRSERFRRLLPYIEMSVEPPVVSFAGIANVGGIEFLADVLGAKTQ